MIPKLKWQKGTKDPNPRVHPERREEIARERRELFRKKWAEDKNIILKKVEERFYLLAWQNLWFPLKIKGYLGENNGIDRLHHLCDGKKGLVCKSVQVDTGSGGCYSWRGLARPRRPREARHPVHCPGLSTNLSYQPYRRFCCSGLGMSIFPAVSPWFCRPFGQRNVVFWTNGSLKVLIY